MADIFREVDEEVRRDKLAQIWKRYGTLITALAVAIVVATAGVVAWQRYQEYRQLQRAEAYAAALQLTRDSDPARAQAALAALAEKDDGFGVLSRLRLAAMKRKAGDTSGAVAMYEELAGDQAVPPAFRDLATILAVLHSLDSGDPAALIARLEPLTVEGSPWRYSALELTGLLARRAGQTDRARQIFAQLAKDPQAPAGVRGRASELLGPPQS